MPQKLVERKPDEIAPDFDISVAISTDNKTLLIRVDEIDGGLKPGEQAVLWVGLSESGELYAGGAKTIGDKK